MTKQPTSSKSQLTPITKFFAEIGHLKRLPKNGMRLTGYMGEGEGTVGQHVVRAAQIGFVLAHLEKADPEKVVTMLLFHDNGEIRIGDQHKVAARYFNVSQAEQAALFEQTDQLPSAIKQTIQENFVEFEGKKTLEAKVAKDADYLETAITAKELLEQGGSVGLNDWIINVGNALQTQSAKKILDLIKSTDDFTNSWWRGLKKV